MRINPKICALLIICELLFEDRMLDGSNELKAHHTYTHSSWLLGGAPSLKADPRVSHSTPQAFIFMRRLVDPRQCV